MVAKKLMSIAIEMQKKFSQVPRCSRYFFVRDIRYKALCNNYNGEHRI